MWQVALHNQHTLSYLVGSTTIELRQLQNSFSIAITTDKSLYKKLSNNLSEHLLFGLNAPYAAFYDSERNMIILAINSCYHKEVLIKFWQQLSILWPDASKYSKKMEEFFAIWPDNAIEHKINALLAQKKVATASNQALGYYHQGNRHGLFIIAKWLAQHKSIESANILLQNLKTDDYQGQFIAAKLFYQLQNYVLALNYITKAGDAPVVQELRNKIFANCIINEAIPEAALPQLPNIKNDAATIAKLLTILQELTADNEAKRIYLEQLQQNSK